MLGIARTYRGATWDSDMQDAPRNGNWGPLVTASSTVNTKGPYTEILASSAFDWYGFWLIPNQSYAVTTDTSQLMDIATGAASSEQILIADLLTGFSPNVGFIPIYFPIYVPAGTRFSARTQSVVSSGIINVSIRGNPANSGLPFPMFSGCDTYGTDSANSTGTGVTAGTSLSWGSDTNVGSTTSRNYGAALAMYVPDDTSLGRGFAWDLRVGGITVAQWQSMEDTSERFYGPYPPVPMLVSIPSGTQLQVRAMTNSATTDPHGCSIYCFY